MPWLATLGACFVALASTEARAQVSEAVSTPGGPVLVDVRWIEGSPRRAEVDLVRGAARLRAYDGDDRVDRQHHMADHLIDFDDRLVAVQFEAFQVRLQRLDDVHRLGVEEVI